MFITRCARSSRKRSALRAGGRTFAESETLSDAGKAAVGATLNDRVPAVPSQSPVCHRSSTAGDRNDESFPQGARNGHGQAAAVDEVFWPVGIARRGAARTTRDRCRFHVGARSGRAGASAALARLRRGCGLAGAAWAPVFGDRRERLRGFGLALPGAPGLWAAAGGQPAGVGTGTGHRPPGVGRDDLGCTGTARSGPCCTLNSSGGWCSRLSVGRPVTPRHDPIELGLHLARIVGGGTRSPGSAGRMMARHSTSPSDSRSPASTRLRQRAG